MLKFVLIGMAHPHIATLYSSLANIEGKTTCLGYADTPAHDTQPVDEKIHQNFFRHKDKIPRYEDYHDLLALNPDVAIICSDNKDCAKISVECMEHGCHVVLEKPMTESYEDAKLICDTAEKLGKKVIVNWPIAAYPAFNKAKELCDAGKIGRVYRVTYRSPATWGPYSYDAENPNPSLDFLGTTWWYHRERGGGSILDYACYGAALTTWFFGRRAQNVQTIAKNFTLPGLDVEDYSAMLLDFGDAVGLLEGSWSTFNPGQIPSGPIIYGELGTIVCDRHSNQCKVYIGRSHGHVEPTEVYDCVPNPDHGFGYDALNHLTKGTPLHPMRRPDVNLDIMYILDQGLKTADATVRAKKEN